MASKPHSYPELIRPGRPWKVRPWVPGQEAMPGTGITCPCTSNADRLQVVPTGNSPFAVDVRFHENFHAKWSPEDLPGDTGVSPMSLLSAEDCRVNLKGALIRPHDAAGHGPAIEAFAIATQWSARKTAQLVAATLGYTSAGRILDELNIELEKITRTLTLPPWLRDHAQQLRNVVYDVRWNAPAFIEVEVNDFNQAINLGRWLDEFEEAVASPKKGSEEGEGEYGDKPGGNGDASNALWGKMRVENPPLTEGKKSRISQRTSPSAQGHRIDHWNRIVTGEVFGRRRKKAVPDAVLIDQSGSMHWNADKLAELVSKMPVGIIAGYSGGNGEGVLKVLARDGKMVARHDVRPFSGGNEIDGPALEWLAKQKGRKVWVSDQAVCSDKCGDEEALMADCQATIDRAGIKTCLSTNPEHIMLALKGLPVPAQDEDEEEVDEEEESYHDDDGDDDEHGEDCACSECTGEEDEEEE